MATEYIQSNGMTREADRPPIRRLNLGESDDDAPGYFDTKELLVYSGRILAAALLIYGMGYFDFSFSWILFGVFVWVWRAKYQREKDFHASISRALAKDEKKEILARVTDLPSWVFFPDTERVEWLNKIIKQLWPYIGDYAKEYIRDVLEPSLRENLSKIPKMNSFKFEKIVLGDLPLKIGGIKVYSDTASRHEIIMDVELYYSGDCYFQVSIGKFKAGLKDLQFHGTARVVMKPLVNKIPLVAGLQVFFLNPPAIDFNLTDVANFLDIPGVADMLRKVVQDVICSMMVLPNKFPVKLISDISNHLLNFPEPKAVLKVQVIEAKDLMKKDIGILGKSDPFVVLNVGAQEFRTEIKNSTVNPVWNYSFEALVDDVQGQSVELDVRDWDQSNKDDLLGRIAINMNDIAKKLNVDNWYQLEDAKTGSIHLQMSWYTLSSNIMELRQYSQTQYKKDTSSSCVLIVYVDHAKDLPNASKAASEPSPFVRISVGGNKQTTSHCVDTNSPIWEKGYCFLIADPENQDLNLEILDDKSKAQLGSLSYSIKKILSETNLKVSQRPFPVGKSGTITLSLQLKILTQQPQEQPAQPNGHHEAPKRDSSPVDPVKTPTEEPHLNGNAEPPSLDEAISNMITPVLKPLDLDSDTLESSLRKRNVLSQTSVDTGKPGVQLTLRYSSQRRKLIVVVHKVVNIPSTNSSDLPDPYVKIVLLPDMSKDGKRKTTVIKNNCNPVYDETFEYTFVPSQLTSNSLLISVCSRSSSIFGRCLILGKTTIDLSLLDLSKATTEFFELDTSDNEEGVSIRSSFRMSKQSHISFRYKSIKRRERNSVASSTVTLVSTIEDEVNGALVSNGTSTVNGTYTQNGVAKPHNGNAKPQNGIAKLQNVTSKPQNGTANPQNGTENPQNGLCVNGNEH